MIPIPKGQSGSNWILPPGIENKTNKSGEDKHSFLRDILKNMNDNTALDLEASWFDPGKVLALEKGEFNEVIKRISVFINQKKIEDFDEIKDLSVNDYMKYIYPKLSSGCCGQTANTLEKLLSGKVTETMAMTRSDMDSFINELRDKANKESGPWYCKTSLGSHAFLIEFVDQKFTIHQSFFGAYSLSASLSENKFIDKDKFLEDLKNSYSSSIPPEKRFTSCKNLFNTPSIGIGDEVVYNFVKNASNNFETVIERINRLRDNFKDDWVNCSENKMKSYSYEKEKEIPPPDLFDELDDNSLNLLCHGKHDNLIDEEYNNIEGVSELKENEIYMFKKFGAIEYTYHGKKDGKHIFKKETNLSR